MKTLIQIKTDDFELISQEYIREMTCSEAVEAYMALRRTFNNEVRGLPQNEWNRCLDQYRGGEGMESDTMERLSGTQKWMIHELDKSDSRMNYQFTKNKEN